MVADVGRMPVWTSTMRRVRIIDGEALAVGARVRVEQPWVAAASTRA